MLRDKVYSISILPNEDGETEDERSLRIEQEVWDGEHTEAFARFVGKYPHDFHGDLLHLVNRDQNNEHLGLAVRLMVEAWVEDFAAELED